MITKQSIESNNAAMGGAAQTVQPVEPQSTRQRHGRVSAATTPERETEPVPTTGTAEDTGNAKTRTTKAGRRKAAGSTSNMAPSDDADGHRQAQVAGAGIEAVGGKKTAAAVTNSDPGTHVTATHSARKTNKTKADVDAGKAGKSGTARDGSKTELVLKKLRLAKGASIKQLVEATGWQAHSVRGFLSAVVRKKMNLALTSETSKDGVRRYRVTDGAAS
jgi:hypothetical protein